MFPDAEVFRRAWLTRLGRSPIAGDTVHHQVGEIRVNESELNAMLERLKWLAKSDDPAVRKAMVSLMAIAATEFRDELKAAFRDSDPKVRREAVIGWGLNLTEFRDELKAASNDTSFEVRLMAEHFLNA